MTRSCWVTRTVRLIMWLVPGAGMFGSSCASDVRESLVAASLDFVEESAGEVLNALIPVDEVLSGGDSA